MIPARIRRAALPLFSAAVAAAVAFKFGAFVAGGSDAHGYVSQAFLWLRGSLVVDQSSHIRAIPLPFVEWMLTPLGYRPWVHSTSMVPVYPPGFPFLMAAFARIGGPAAVFAVVPLLASLTVLVTYALGTLVDDWRTGALAAFVLAASPAWLFMSVAPMSDVPVTFWWTLAIALTATRDRAAAFVAGLAVSAAITTRPNLAPLALVLAGGIAADAVLDRHAARAAWTRCLLVLAGTLPGCVALAAVFNHLYGSPLVSGYGDMSPLFAARNLVPNITRYTRWLLETETPLIALSLAAPFVLPRARDATALLAFAAGVFGAYLFYEPFDAWWYLRFLLPAFPPLLVLAVACLRHLLRRVAGTRAEWIAALLCTTAAVWGAATAVDRGVLRIARDEQRYITVSRYVEAALPQNAVLLSVLHSGSVRFYSGRLTLRYPWLGAAMLDRAVRTLVEAGYQPYFLLEGSEEAEFSRRFAPHSALGRLDWPPIAELAQPGAVRIYDPRDRDRYLHGATVRTQRIQPVTR